MTQLAAEDGKLAHGAGEVPGPFPAGLELKGMPARLTQTNQSPQAIDYKYLIWELMGQTVSHLSTHDSRLLQLCGRAALRSFALVRENWRIDFRQTALSRPEEVETCNGNISTLWRTV
jgi:hypothetical protein